MSLSLSLSFPKFIQIETVRECNARCRFCAHGTGQLLEKGFMSEELFDKIASEVIEHKDEISRVQLNELGEPLLDKKIAERIRRFKDGGIREVLLITNGALLDERKAVEILEAGIDILRCSITTINPEKYPLLRRGLNLETVLANINRYIELRDAINKDSRIYISTEKDPLLTDEDIEQWEAYWKNRLSHNDVLKISELFSFGLQLSSVDKTRELGIELSTPCIPMMQTIYIPYNGKVPLCCIDFGWQIPVGDANVSSLQEIWQNDIFSAYREMHRNGRRKEIPLCLHCDGWEPKQNLAGEKS